MKIVVVSQFLDSHTGGAERYIHEVCSRLETQHGFNVQYVSGDTCQQSGLSAANLRLFSSGFNLKWYTELKEQFRRENPDMIYIHYTVPGMADAAFFAAKRLQLPCAVMYHSDVTGLGWLKKCLGVVCYHLSVKHILSRCKYLFVSSGIYKENSPFLRKIKRQCIPAPPGIDEVFGKTDGISGRNPVAAENTPFILFVGKPDLKEKGFHVLLQAWRKLKQTQKDINLVVVGERRSIQEGSTHEPGLVYTGSIRSRQELREIYQSALVTVLPSLTPESFGMVLAEALAAGCPVIASNIGGIPALVTDGDNGHLVEPGDVDSLVNVLEKSLTSNAVLRKNIQNKKAAMLARYNWDNTAAIMASSFRSGNGD